MQKFFIVLAAGILFVACTKNESTTTETSGTVVSTEVAAPSLIAEHVLIGNLFYNLYDNKTAEVVKDDNYWNTLSGPLTISSTIEYNNENYTVTSIGYNAFFCCRELTSITIPNSVTSIGDAAFNCCSSVTSITIPNSVTSIGDDVFGGCNSKLPIYTEHVFIYLPMTYTGAYAIPKGITQIAGGAFEACSGLTSITIPNSVTSIGNEAFQGCIGLTSIVIPNSVTSIGNEAFRGCIGLTSIVIPNSVTSIGSGVFWECLSLTSITIPKGITSLGDDPFYMCPELQHIVYNYEE